jgi:hypothetical protein
VWLNPGRRKWQNCHQNENENNYSMYLPTVLWEIQINEIIASLQIDSKVAQSSSQIICDAIWWVLERLKDSNEIHSKTVTYAKVHL